ncbi:hypothetical protein [Methylobacterium trifolii]|uniref:Pilus assembly protein n=1 Tax=Methylobacterium trifolii TaxID=1003092 RepID=A0ABQ4TYA6_9HYPH|nr:hypothetical protein [Methylobacterium trifolii]GJE60041.1 hypothetical protein MPOCJGCO_2150 [Methylobacterium trifolii]
MRRPLLLCLTAALPLLLTACQDYLARRDTLTLGSGEAVQANMARHVIDPWPPRSDRIDFETDGERAAHAIERYRNPSSGSGIAILPPVPVGPSNVPSINAPSLR